MKKYNHQANKEFYEASVEFEPKDDMAYERFHRTVEAIKKHFDEGLKLSYKGNALTVNLKDDAFGDFYLRASILGKHPKITVKADSKKRAKECLGKTLCFLLADD